MKRTILTAATALLATAAAFAHEEQRAGDLLIDHPVIRATPAGAPVSGGYMTIRNTGEQADRLVGGAAGFAGKVEIHEMVMDGDVMTMREIDGGIAIGPGEAVMLMPGGLHVMFMQLSEDLDQGDEHTVTLTFEKAGAVEIDFDVLGLAAIREQMDADAAMDHAD